MLLTHAYCSADAGGATDAAEYWRRSQGDAGGGQRAATSGHGG